MEKMDNMPFFEITQQAFSWIPDKNIDILEICELF